jgi:hypothetical protein
LTLVDDTAAASQVPLQLPPASRSIPRSSTSASLSIAFERSAAASVFKKQAPASRTRQWSESTESVNEKQQHSTWSNKFASKSKRFYQLMASNISSQSLSEQAGKHASDDKRGGLPSVASSATLLGMSNTNTVNNFAALRQQQEQQAKQPYQTASSSKLVLRPSDAQSMMQWAEAISRCLGATPRTLRSPASLSTLPFHARPRLPRVVSKEEDEDGGLSFYRLPGTTSSLVSAAMASRRKREDSGVKTIDTQTAMQGNTKQQTPPLPQQSQLPATEQSKGLFAALKAKRRASLEIFASTLTGRKNSNDFESRATTISNGNSTRSSICCAGEAARMSWERSNRTTNGGHSSTGSPPPSLAAFSSPFSSRMVFTSARRRSSIKSNHSSFQQSAPVAPSAAVAASMTGSTSFLDMNNSSSSAEDFDTNQQQSSAAGSSAGSSNMPSPFSIAPMTPIDSEGGNISVNVATASDKQQEEHPMMVNAKRMGWPRNSPAGMLGLNLYYDSFKDHSSIEPDVVLPSLAYRGGGFESHNVIVESPTREDLATLLGNTHQHDNIEEKLSSVKVYSPLRRSVNKLAHSPSMPMLHRDYNTATSRKVSIGIDEDDVYQSSTSSTTVSAAPSSLLTSIQASPLRFSNFGKVAGRRPMFQQQQQQHAQPKADRGGGGVTASSSTRSNLMNKISPPSRVASPLQRPSTSTGFRDLSNVNNTKSTYFGLDESSAPAPQLQTSQSHSPRMVVERILPPEEMIATFDRLRSQSSSVSLNQASKIRPSISRPVLVDMSQHQQQNRTAARPRTSAMTAF